MRIVKFATSCRCLSLCQTCNKLNVTTNQALHSKMTVSQRRSTAPLHQWMKPDTSRLGLDISAMLRIIKQLREEGGAACQSHYYTGIK